MLGKKRERLGSEIHENVVKFMYMWYSSIWCRILAYVVKIHIGVVNACVCYKWMAWSKCVSWDVCEMLIPNSMCCYKWIIEGMCLNWDMNEVFV